MEKFFYAIGLVVLLAGAPAKSDELDAAEEKIDEIDSRDVDAEEVDSVSNMPIEGDEQIREAAEPHGRLAQPRRQLTEQVDGALDNLKEAEANNALLEHENGSLRDEIHRLKLSCAQMDRKADKSKRAKKTAKAPKKDSKKRYAKAKPGKRSSKAEAKRLPASKKKLGLQKLGTKKRMVASVGPHGLATELPKKRSFDEN